MRVELFFDCSSPATYLWFHRLGLMAEAMDFQVTLRPIFIGGVFKAVNREVWATMATMPKIKEEYWAKDFKDWEKFTGLRIHWPQTEDRVNSVKAMRGVVAAGRRGMAREMARATFEAYWHDGLDISLDEVLTGVCARVGYDPEQYFREISDDSIKAELRANTDELVERGGFGTPFTFIDGDDRFFGNDRIELIRASIERIQARETAGAIA